MQPRCSMPSSTRRTYSRSMPPTCELRSQRRTRDGTTLRKSGATRLMSGMTNGKRRSARLLLAYAGSLIFSSRNGIRKSTSGGADAPLRANPSCWDTRNASHAPMEWPMSVTGCRSSSAACKCGATTSVK